MKHLELDRTYWMPDESVTSAELAAKLELSQGEVAKLAALLSDAQTEINNLVVLLDQAHEDRDEHVGLAAQYLDRISELEFALRGIRKDVEGIL